MSQFIEHFHWLRPLWLFGLLPALLLTGLLWQQKRGARKWQQFIAPELLAHLLENASLRPRRWQLYSLLAGWIIACFALAGPSWEKRSAPVHLSEDALVLILDLSPSMLAEDITPSRLVRARLKIADILRERRDGQTALIAYAGDAHVVAPLTDDHNTITNLLTALHPGLMPMPGSNTEAAVAQALELLRAGSALSGDILLITDGVVASARRDIIAQLQDTPYRLSILGVGTEEGAPVPTGQSGFARDRHNKLIIARLHGNELQQLASQGKGRYHRITHDNSDLEWLVNQTSALEQHSREVEREFDNWYDRGHWLALLLLPLLLYCFRRGVLLSLFLCAPLLALYPGTSHAFSWRDLWLTADQQAQQALAQGDPEQAAQQFKTPEWKGSAQYRAGDYESAADTFEKLDTPQAHYNRGNALARAGRLEEALAAYDHALQHRPNWEDAHFNRALVEQLLQQQEQQGGDEGDEGDQQDNNDNQQGDGDSQSQEGADGREGEQQEQNGDQNQDQQDETPDDESSPEPDTREDQADQQDEQQQHDQDGDELSAEPELSEALPDAEDLSEEERQALEQWLRRVPDDPGGLLRRKFEYQHQQQRLQRLRGNWQQPAPDSEERW